MSETRQPLALEIDSSALIACEREPIRTPGAIQRRGALLVVDEPEFRLLYASDNLEPYLGRPARELLGRALPELSADRLGETAAALLAGGATGRPARLELASGRVVDCFAHRTGGRLVIELEDAGDGEAGASFETFQDDVLATLGRFQHAGDVASVLAAAVSVVHDLTGFDRVLAYRFEPDGHGVVVDERKPEHLTSLLGLHYPASDIPAQARALYREKWIRLIPDSTVAAVDLAGLASEPPPSAVDLSNAVMRAVSPIHLQYLRNMGVQASMSISLVVEDALWGLIVCHDYRGPRAVSYRVRAACEVVGLTASMAIGTKAELAVAERRVGLERVGAAIVERVAGAPSIAEGLLDDPALLLGVCEATGVAVRIGGALRVSGETPSEQDVEQLVEAVRSQLEGGALYATDALGLEHPALARLSASASGVLAMNLSHDAQNAIVWFRPEQVRTVTWAGEPQKVVDVTPEGARWLGPRTSFAEWAEIVRGRSEPWNPAALAAVQTLRASLGSFLFERAEQLAQLNAELSRSNAELDAFAFMVAHDLNEPLRAIHRFADFLREDGADAQGAEHAATIATLSDRMRMLLDSLLAYARVGRAQLDLRPLDLREVVSQALETLTFPLAASGATVEVHGSPTVVGDAVQLREVFTNLVSNAIKYTDRPAPRIDVRVGEEGGQQVVSVCDDGIGIAAEHLDEVFSVFRRLHLRDAYGGGSGAGLTIVRRIVERHDGTVWIESPPGGGTCVRFTLAAGGGHDR